MIQINSPLPLFGACPVDLRAAASHLFFDVDDTLTCAGQVPERTMMALYRAHKAGIHLVAVTGRSAAWAEMLLRLFPLRAAVAETGALCLYKAADGQVREIHSEPDADTRAEHDLARARAAARVLREVRGARLALDNRGRAYDTAFDLVEDGPALEEIQAQAIRQILTEEGLKVAQSSVHINAWFGHFDKATMVQRYLQDRADTSLESLGQRLVYVGDSKNDGAMFARAGISVGVANVVPHLAWLQERGQAPDYMTSSAGGLGFAELVGDLLAPRSSHSNSNASD